MFLREQDILDVEIEKLGFIGVFLNIQADGDSIKGLAQFVPEQVTILFYMLHNLHALMLIDFLPCPCKNHFEISVLDSEQRVNFPLEYVQVINVFATWI